MNYEIMPLLKHTPFSLTIWLIPEKFQRAEENVYWQLASALKTLNVISNWVWPSNKWKNEVSGNPGAIQLHSSTAYDYKLVKLGTYEDTWPWNF